MEYIQVADRVRFDWWTLKGSSLEEEAEEVLDSQP